MIGHQAHDLAEDGAAVGTGDGFAAAQGGIGGAS